MSLAAVSAFPPLTAARSAQPGTASAVVCSIDHLVVLAEEFLALSSGKVSQDHRRIRGSSVGPAVT